MQQLRALQKRQEDERIYEQQKLNDRLISEVQMKKRHGGALDGPAAKPEERYTMIFEQPDEEDRESLPIEKGNRDRMKPTIAKD